MGFIKDTALLLVPSYCMPGGLGVWASSALTTHPDTVGYHFFHCIPGCTVSALAVLSLPILGPLGEHVGGHYATYALRGGDHSTTGGGGGDMVVLHPCA